MADETKENAQADSGTGRPGCSGSRCSSSLV